MSAPTGPVQPEQRFVIDALLEENRALYDNKLYLLSMLKQMQAEFAHAHEQWEAERESLKKTTKP